MASYLSIGLSNNIKLIFAHVTMYIPVSHKFRLEPNTCPTSTIICILSIYNSINTLPPKAMTSIIDICNISYKAYVATLFVVASNSFYELAVVTI